MRRKISLYIVDQQVDLDDQSFILFNYTMDDLSNPAIVKNSFSQQITLKGTPANNKVFGHYFKTDRWISNTGGETGTGFNASQKTPFTIYDEMGSILESGYVKLDSVSRNGTDIEYKISLFGGLGSFFYSLSYDESGEKRNLASLDYLGTSNPNTELDFTINAQAIRDAWARLSGDTSVSEIWDVINFAPAYNGIPDGNFSADKALVNPADVGLQPTIGNYTTKSGYCLVSMAEAQDEWAVKDLRSYLQRPVLSMSAFWDAICNPANNGGYEVDASIVRDSVKFGEYSFLWLTLPMIPSIGTIKQDTGDLSLTMTSNPTASNPIGRYDVSGSVPSGTRVTANLSCRIRFIVPAGADDYNELSNIVSQRMGRSVQYKYNVLFIQAVAYGSDDSIVGGSKIKIVTPKGVRTQGMAAACGYVPAWSESYEGEDVESFIKVSSGVFEIPSEMTFTIDAQDVAYYKILVSQYSAVRQVFEGGGGNPPSVSTSYSGDGSVSTPVLYVDFDDVFSALLSYISQGESGNTITYTSSDTLRSGAKMTKAMLLSSSHTPAEYMISFCKIFGLYFTYDNDARKVTIHRRNELYQDETIDLQKRVDLSKGISLKPLLFQAKWYDFILEGVGGSFYDEYQEVEGEPYGIQRVNTGYDFNADSVNLMESVVFKTACSVLARSKYFNYIFRGSLFIPSPFVDKGNKYTLWSAEGETLDTDISCPPSSASVTYYNSNPDYKGYDAGGAEKLELRNSENKPIDGSDILVFFKGWKTYQYFKVTDDVPAMDVLNDGVPCWLLGAGLGLSVPIFQRYIYADDRTIAHSLDFGIPKELDIPGVSFAEGSSIYEKAWKRYISDRYNVNTKVMTCRVDFSGIRVNQGLLRKFYWYDNSLWVLNAIRNYSLTTFDPVECEFVQVQYKDNYLTGQSY